MNLASSWRPKRLCDIVGNRSVVLLLKKLLKGGREDIPHTYLLSGPSGTGKTTLARIIAKKLGCHNLNFRELNVADNRGIDFVRKINKEARTPPLVGKAVLYLFDEAHQFTGNAKDALLKLIEDTPPHAYFVFATTEPTKMIATIRTRCTKLQTQLLTDSELTKLVEQVLTEIDPEGKVNFSLKVWEKLIKVSHGTPRNALNNLQKIMEVETSKDQLDLLQDFESMADVIDLCRAAFKGEDWEDIMELYKQVKANQGGGDVTETVRRSILGYCKSCMLSPKTNRSFAKKVARVIDLFSAPTYDGGEAQLLSMLFKAGR